MTKQTVYLNNFARKSGFRLQFLRPVKLTTVGAQVNSDSNVNPILHTNILKGKKLVMYFQYSSYEFPAVYN